MIEADAPGGMVGVELAGLAADGVEVCGEFARQVPDEEHGQERGYGEHGERSVAHPLHDAVPDGEHHALRAGLPGGRRENGTGHVAGIRVT